MFEDKIRKIMVRMSVNMNLHIQLQQEIMFVQVEWN